MVGFVEDVTCRHRRIVEAAKGRLGHDQRMIGDDDARAAGFADVLLDKAAAKMRASGVHAFAAAVGERADPCAADQLGQPAGKIAGQPGHPASLAVIQRATSPSWAAARPGRVTAAAAASS